MYGILIAIGEESSFQIVGEVDSIEEANALASEYLAIGPDASYVAPYQFEIHRRGDGGGWTKIEVLAIPSL